MPQIPLNLTIAEEKKADNFILSDCNSQAYKFITDFPDGWVSNSLLLVGEEFSGKTHLALIWKDRAEAEFLNGKQLAEVLNSEIKTHLVIDDIDELTQADEENLFHIFNRCKDAGRYLLMTSKKPVYELGFTLPDLKSRISSSLISSIEQPSEEFLHVMFHKHFLDMQVQVPDRVISYITSRIQRSFKSVYEIAEILNKKSVETKRPISIPFVKEVLQI